MATLFDTHAHLSPTFFDEPVRDLIGRASDAGVEFITTIGSGDNLDLCREAIALAKSYDNIFAAIGIHPHSASVADADPAIVDAIGELARANPDEVRAIGETGLDYHYMNSPKAAQQSVFARFLELAIDVERPVVIHNRDSDQDCIQILRECHAERCGGVIHCFSASWALAEAALELGFYISFSGILTFKRAEEIREVARRVPRDRLLVETDAPFLAPVPKRGKKNEPAYTAHTANRLADELEVDRDEMWATLLENARRFYGLDPR